MNVLQLDFAGEVHQLDGSVPFFVGREGDLRIDDNPYLHRRVLLLTNETDLWWLANVGTRSSVTVSDPAGGIHAWLAPGSRMPLVFASTCIRFTAGSTSYEIDASLPEAVYEVGALDVMEDGTTTLGRVDLTVDQKLMLVVLAESALRQGVPGIAQLPSAPAAALRLGWTQKKFEKKIDNVCDRLAGNGVRGLKGDFATQATSRRARLVEYALAARLVTPADLALLESCSNSTPD
jgi:hypothetical protein